MTNAVYENLFEAAILFDRRLGVIRAEGPDRVSWLQGMVTSDVARLAPGQGRYAAHLTPQGKVVSQLTVLAEEDALLLVTEQENVAATQAALERLLIMEDAALADLTPQLEAFALAGAGARALLERWAGFGLRLDQVYDHVSVGATRVLATELGFDLLTPAGEAAALSEALTARGALRGDDALWEVLRVEAGLPRFGVDVDPTTTFPELGGRGIDYDKGCYIGQEVVARIKYIGHVNRVFVGLKLSGDAIPAAGAPVRRGGRDVGRVTSAVRSPGLGAVIALGYVKTGAEQPGAEVEVAVGDAAVPAVVSALPFIARP